MHHHVALFLASSDVVGFVLFGIFVVAFAVLAVVVVTWALRRDRAGRAAWRQRAMSDPQGWPDEPDAGEPSRPRSDGAPRPDDSEPAPGGS